MLQATDLHEGRKRLTTWEAQVRESGVPELLKALDTIERHRSVSRTSSPGASACGVGLIIDCPPGCYTLLGERLDKEGNIVNAVRADWKNASAFVTPPGWWHAHYNESGADAHLLPIQDAGLQTHMRTLDIQFVHPKHESHISWK